MYTHTITVLKGNVINKKCNFQIEQEVERIREAHKLLEESTKRREKLENAVRTKMEHQLKKLKETNFQLESKTFLCTGKLIF